MEGYSPTPRPLNMMIGMEYATHFQPQDRSRAPRPARLTWNHQLFAGAIGFLVFALLYVSIGIRWHTYRARANLYAQQEMESTFQAAAYKRLARSPGLTEDSSRRALEYRRVAEMHARAAEESGRLRQLYEEAW